MPNFAANLTMMFTEWPFLDRFQAAADAGFTAVEYLFPYEFPPNSIAARLSRHGLVQALFNLPPGDWAGGERGLAALPDRFDQVVAGVTAALPYIEATGVRRVHLMAGIASRSDPAAIQAYRRSVLFAAETLGDRGIDLALEPINGRDMPGYFLDDYGWAEAFIRELGRPNVKLQFDVYHRQIMHGDVTMAFRRLLPLVGHVQIASVPSRNEPDGEEFDYGFLFGEIDRLGYAGFVGCEYRPRGRTLDGLGWFEAYARKAESAR